MPEQSREEERLVSKYKSEIASLEKQEEDILRRIKTMENLIPNVIIWYMWKISQNDKPAAYSQKDTEEVQRELSRLEAILTEFQEADSLLKEEETNLCQRIEELEDTLKDTQSIGIALSEPSTFNTGADRQKISDEIVNRDKKTENGKREQIIFKKVLKDTDIEELDWKQKNEELCVEENKVLETQVSEKLEETEKYIPKLEEDNTLKGGALQDKLDDLEKETQDEFAKEIEKEQESKYHDLKQPNEDLGIEDIGLLENQGSEKLKESEKHIPKLEEDNTLKDEALIDKLDDLEKETQDEFAKEVEKEQESKYHDLKHSNKDLGIEDIGILENQGSEKLKETEKYTPKLKEDNTLKGGALLDKLDDLVKDTQDEFAKEIEKEQESKYPDLKQSNKDLGIEDIGILENQGSEKLKETEKYIPKLEEDNTLKDGSLIDKVNDLEKETQDEFAKEVEKEQESKYHDLKHSNKDLGIEDIGILENQGSEKLKESEKYIPKLEEDNTLKDGALLEKLDDLEIETQNVFAEVIEKEKERALEEEHENKKSTLAVAKVMEEEIKTIKQSHTDSEREQQILDEIQPVEMVVPFELSGKKKEDEDIISLKEEQLRKKEKHILLDETKEEISTSLELTSEEVILPGYAGVLPKSSNLHSQIFEEFKMKTATESGLESELPQESEHNLDSEVRLDRLVLEPEDEDPTTVHEALLDKPQAVVESHIPSIETEIPLTVLHEKSTAKHEEEPSTEIITTKMEALQFQKIESNIQMISDESVAPPEGTHEMYETLIDETEDTLKADSEIYLVIKTKAPPNDLKSVTSVAKFPYKITSESSISGIGDPKSSEKGSAKTMEALAIISEPPEVQTTGEPVPSTSYGFATQQMSNIREPPSAEGLVAQTLQGKCRVKDHLIKSMADQLRDLAKNNIWSNGQMVLNTSKDPVKTYDFDRTTLLQYLKGEEPMDIGFSLKSNEDHSITNPLNVKVCKIDQSSLMVEWDPSPSEETAGFQIFVNGEFKYWVHSANRNIALLHPLDLANEIEIAVCPLDDNKKILNRSSVKYTPQTV